MTIGIFSGFSENPRDFWQIPGIRDFFVVSGFLSPGFSSPGFGIFFSLGIFIPGIRDFFKSRDFYPRDSGFFLISGFLSLEFGIFIPRIRDFFGIFDLRDIPGIFYPRDRDFFSWDGISRQKATSGNYMPLK